MHTTNLELRAYQDTDLPAVMACWENASALAHPFLPTDFVDTVRRDIPALYLPAAETWVAEREGAVIGFIALLQNEIGALFVEPRFHGQRDRPPVLRSLWIQADRRIVS